MRQVSTVAALACLALVAGLRAQQPASSQEVFRVGVDVIRLDVTVLDKNRQPVRGLTAEDFLIKEDGRPQRIVAVTEVEAADVSPAQTAWMRYAPRDVTTNDLADQLGEGQAVAIVLDDFNIPDDSVEMAVSAREIGRFIVNSLGPSDVAAVVFPLKAGRTQDFTYDRAKLLNAIDRFEPEQPEFRTLQSEIPGQMQGDIQRYSPVLGRDPCLQLQPAIPTLRTVTSRLASVPNRRKSLFFVSMGLMITFSPGRTRCQGMLYEEMRRTFEDAQRFNVNIHGIDPGGAAGYQRLLQNARLRNGRMSDPTDLFAAKQQAGRRHDFLETLAEQTGGRAVADTDDLDRAVAEIFDEYASYYLVGYETTNGAPDGKFRKVEVEVVGRDLDVRARSGRWAPDANSAVASTGQRTAAANDLNLTGLMPRQALALRAALYPVARGPSGAPGRSGDVEMAAVLAVRLPAVLRAADESLTVIRTVYDARGRGGPPARDAHTRTLVPSTGDESMYEVYSRFALPPGRHQVRFNAASRVADASGSVIVDVEVPDLGRSGFTASLIVLGLESSGDRTDPLQAVLPVVPTTVRDFTRADRVTAFLRMFSGTTPLTAPVTVAARLLGTDNAQAIEIPPVAIPPEAFEATRSAEFRTDLPLSSLAPGLHLLSITATFDGTRTVRRDLVFRVR